MPETAPTDPTGWEGILEPGERIVWQGRPDTKILWSRILSFESAFGLFFGGFALFWIVMAATMSASAGGFGLIFPLFGLPFLGVGLWMVVGRIIWDARVRARTWYTLTDRTAFIATATGETRNLETYPIRPEMDIQLEDGSPGTVWFERQVTHHPGGYSGSGSNRRYRGPRTTVTPIGFRRIDDPRHVYRLLRDSVSALKRAETADAPLA